jgi:hypothetical protein
MSLDKSVAGKYKLGEGMRRKVSTPLTIGLVYKGIDKFFGKPIVGMLLEIYSENDEAVLKTKEGEFVSVVKKSLKIVA